MVFVLLDTSIVSFESALMFFCFVVTVMSESFKARDIGLRAQKKILGRMAANKSARKIFIDDNTASLLDNLFKMIRLYVSNPAIGRSGIICRGILSPSLTPKKSKKNTQ